MFAGHRLLGNGLVLNRLLRNGVLVHRVRLLPPPLLGRRRPRLRRRLLWSGGGPRRRARSHPALRLGGVGAHRSARRSRSLCGTRRLRRPAARGRGIVPEGSRVLGRSLVGAGPVRPGSVLSGPLSAGSVLHGLVLVFAPTRVRHAGFVPTNPASAADLQYGA
ncbi:hypothetical protein GCM10009642_28590 [Nocardiopsis metallicus]